MSDAVTDTHGLIWYLEDDPRLGSAALSAFEASDRGEIVIYVPPICLVEIVYLQEKGRIPPNLRRRLITILQTAASGLIPMALTLDIVDIIGQLPRTIIPDMPDRIIAATALHLGLPLLTKDSKIQLSRVQTIW